MSDNYDGPALADQVIKLRAVNRVSQQEQLAAYREALERIVAWDYDGKPSEFARKVLAEYGRQSYPPDVIEAGYYSQLGNRPVEKVVTYRKPEPTSDDNYPCEGCGKPRTKAQGGTTFTVCDTCWEIAYGSKSCHCPPDNWSPLCPAHGKKYDGTEGSAK